jgi:alkylhydroperoxidase family enzyme
MMLGKKAGFTDAQVLEIRSGKASFDAKLDALARLVHDMVVSKGHPDQARVDAFLAAGWTKGNLVDAIVVIGDKTVTNYLHGATHVPVDFPAAPPLPR